MTAYYRILRGTSPSNLQLIGASTTTTYSDTVVAAATTYYYAIASVDTSGNISATIGSRFPEDALTVQTETTEVVPAPHLTDRRIRPIPFGSEFLDSLLRGYGG